MTLTQFPTLPSRKLPIISIGAGGIVRHAHLPAYQLAEFEVWSIYDLVPAKAYALAHEFGIKRVCSTLSEAILSAPSEAVYDLALPAQSIAETLAQLPSNSYILIQKPMGETLAQAREILDICRRKDLHGAINFQLRTAPYVLASRDLIQSGVIGDILEIDVKVTVQTPWADWSFLESSPRMEIVYHSIHYLDFIRCLLGNPVGVKANTIKHPASAKLHSSRSAIILDYGTNQRAQIVTYHAHDYGDNHQESQIRIEGTNGCIVFQMGLNRNYPHGSGDWLEYYTKSSGKWTQIDLQGSWFPHAFIGPMSAMMTWASDPQNIPETHIGDAYQTMQLVEAAYINAESSGTPLPD